MCVNMNNVTTDDLLVELGKRKKETGELTCQTDLIKLMNIDENNPLRN